MAGVYELMLESRSVILEGFGFGPYCLYCLYCLFQSWHWWALLMETRGARGPFCALSDRWAPRSASSISFPSWIQVFQLFPLLDSRYSTFSLLDSSFSTFFASSILLFPPRPSTARQPPSKQVRGQAAQWLHTSCTSASLPHHLALPKRWTLHCPSPISRHMTLALAIALESIFGVLFWFWLIGYNLDPRRACPLFPSFLSSATPHPSINPHIFNARPSQQLAESFRKTEEAPRPTCLHHTPTAFK